MHTIRLQGLKLLHAARHDCSFWIFSNSESAPSSPRSYKAARGLLQGRSSFSNYLNVLFLHLMVRPCSRPSFPRDARMQRIHVRDDLAVGGPGLLSDYDIVEISAGPG